MLLEQFHIRLEKEFGEQPRSVLQVSHHLPLVPVSVITRNHEMQCMSNIVRALTLYLYIPLFVSEKCSSKINYLVCLEVLIDNYQVINGG